MVNARLAQSVEWPCLFYARPRRFFLATRSITPPKQSPSQPESLHAGPPYQGHGHDQVTDFEDSFLLSCLLGVTLGLLIGLALHGCERANGPTQSPVDAPSMRR